MATTVSGDTPLRGQERTRRSAAAGTKDYCSFSSRCGPRKADNRLLELRAGDATPSGGRARCPGCPCPPRPAVPQVPVDDAQITRPIIPTLAARKVRAIGASGAGVRGAWDRGSAPVLPSWLRPPASVSRQVLATALAPRYSRPRPWRARAQRLDLRGGGWDFQVLVRAHRVVRHDVDQHRPVDG